MTNTSHTINPNQWVANYSDYLFNYAYYRTNNQSDAENLVQETFLAALKSQHNFKGDSTEKTWLTSILKHKIIDFYRTKYREQPVSQITENDTAIDAFFDRDDHMKNPPKEWQANPRDLQENKEFWHTFRDCCDKLTEIARNVFIAKELEKMDAKTICSSLKISQNNYWVILHRSRLQLRECLERNWFNTN